MLSLFDDLVTVICYSRPDSPDPELSLVLQEFVCGFGLSAGVMLMNH